MAIAWSHFSSWPLRIRVYIAVIAATTAANSGVSRPANVQRIRFGATSIAISGIASRRSAPYVTSSHANDANTHTAANTLYAGSGSTATKDSARNTSPWSGDVNALI